MNDFVITRVIIPNVLYAKPLPFFFKQKMQGAFAVQWFLTFLFSAKATSTFNFMSTKRVNKLLTSDFVILTKDFVKLTVL